MEGDKKISKSGVRILIVDDVEVSKDFLLFKKGQSQNCDVLFLIHCISVIFLNCDISTTPLFI